jgi:hypothetical protein
MNISDFVGSINRKGLTDGYRALIDLNRKVGFIHDAINDDINKSTNIESDTISKIDRFFISEQNLSSLNNDFWNYSSNIITQYFAIPSGNGFEYRIFQYANTINISSIIAPLNSIKTRYNNTGTYDISVIYDYIDIIRNIGDEISGRIIKLEKKVGSDNEIATNTGVNGSTNTTNTTIAENIIWSNSYSALDKNNLSNVTNKNKVLYLNSSNNLAFGANGVAEPIMTDAGGKIPPEILPSYVSGIIEYPTLNDFPQQPTGLTGIIYVAMDNLYSYRSTGTAYIQVTDSRYFLESGTTVNLSMNNKNIVNCGEIFCSNLNATSLSSNGYYNPSGEQFFGFGNNTMTLLKDISMMDGNNINHNISGIGTLTSTISNLGTLGSNVNLGNKNLSNGGIITCTNLNTTSLASDGYYNTGGTQIFGFGVNNINLLNNNINGIGTLTTSTLNFSTLGSDVNLGNRNLSNGGVITCTNLNTTSLASNGYYNTTGTQIFGFGLNNINLLNNNISNIGILSATTSNLGTLGSDVNLGSRNLINGGIITCTNLNTTSLASDGYYTSGGIQFMDAGNSTVNFKKSIFMENNNISGIGILSATTTNLGTLGSDVNFGGKNLTNGGVITCTNLNVPNFATTTIYDIVGNNYINFSGNVATFIKPINMFSNDITNVNAITATTGNFTNINLSTQIFGGSGNFADLTVNSSVVGLNGNFTNLTIGSTANVANLNIGSTASIINRPIKMQGEIVTYYIMAPQYNTSVEFIGGTLPAFCTSVQFISNVIVCISVDGGGTYDYISGYNTNFSWNYSVLSRILSVSFISFFPPSIVSIKVVYNLN